MECNQARCEYDAFVSHAGDCTPWVEAFVKNLVGLGLLVYGESFSDGSSDYAIAKSSAFIQIISPASFSRGEIHSHRRAVGVNPVQIQRRAKSTVADAGNGGGVRVPRSTNSVPGLQIRIVR